MTNTLKGTYAGFISRLLAYAVDIVVIFVILVFMGWLLNTMSTLFHLDLLDSIAIAIQVWIASMVTILFSAGYYIFFWTLVGRTPGKILLGLRVVSRDGKPLTFWQALRRYIGYFLSALAIYIGYLWILLDNRRQGWHDKLAGTYVIYDWDARPGTFLANLMEARQSEKDQSSSE